MIVLDAQGLNGYDAEGLNGGLKIAKALKKVTLKGAINVVKTVAPMALSLIPVVGGSIGGAVGKALAKVTTNANGSANLIGRIADGVQKVAQTDIGKSVVALAKPLVKNAKAALLEQAGALPNDAQFETLAAAKGTTPQQELDAMVAAVPDTAVAKTAVTPTTPAKDNTMLYVGGGIIGAGVLYAILK